MKSTFPDCLRGAAVRGFSLQQVRNSHAGLHIHQELPVFKAAFRLFLKSQVCLGFFSRHFKQHYCKLTGSIVLYCNYQTIMDVLCLRILIWVYGCFTVLQLIPYSHISKQTVKSKGWKKSIYLLTYRIRQIKMLSKVTSAQNESMFMSQA